MAVGRAPTKSTGWPRLNVGASPESPPDQLIASRVSDNHINMTRPICSYPAVPTYNGVGTTNDAANFTCKLP